MFVALEFFWVGCFFIFAFFKSKFPLQDFLLSLLLSIVLFGALLQSQGLMNAIEFALKVFFIFICILFVRDNLRFAAITLIATYLLFAFFGNTYGLKGTLPPPWLVYLLPFAAFDFENALKRADKNIFIVFIALTFLYLFILSFRTQALILIAVAFLGIFRNFYKHALFTIPVILFFSLAFFGSQFYYFFDENIEAVSRSNIQRSFYSFYILSDLPNYLFGKSSFLFAEEMWYLLPDLFAVSSYNYSEIDPHNFVALFLLFGGVPGVLIYFLIIFLTTRNISIKKNQLLLIALVSILVSMASLATFSSVSRLSFALIIGLLHAVTSYEKEAKHNNNLF